MAVVPDVPWLRCRWTWRGAGRPPKQRSLSTDPDKPSATPRDPKSRMHRHSFSACRPIFPPVGRGGLFRAQPASWSRRFYTTPAELLSLHRPRREQSSRLHSPLGSSWEMLVVVVAMGDDVSSVDDVAGRPAVFGNLVLWGIGYRGRYHRGTNVEHGCSTFDCDIRHSRRSAASLL